MSQTRHILLVDDEESDADLTRVAFQKAGGDYTIHVCRDGAAALRFLNQHQEYADAPRPSLVLLDLNMPLLGGREVIKALKQAPGLNRIPVVVLTSSEADRDIRDAYSLGANAYIAKSPDFLRFVADVKSVCLFWFETVSLPD